MSPLREWLIAIGTLVIIGIVVDGIRRMRRARQESAAISSGMGADKLQQSPLDENFNPELPTGGARTIPRDELDQSRTAPKKMRNAPYAQKPTRPVIAVGRKQKPEPSVIAPASETQSVPVSASDRSEVDCDSSEFTEAPLSDEYEQWEPEAFSADEDSDLSAFESTMPEPEPAPMAVPSPRDSSQPLAGANRPLAQEVIVINVLARAGDEFKGPALQQLLEACGLLYGDMDIYHRHETSNTTSPVQFSIASAVEPGTFRPAEIANLSTPGISFFMSLPGPSNAMQAFNFMYETAQAVVRNLGGELKDERRSVMTSQTAEHCRQRIREFERKQRSKRD